jgi:uncharacterized protein involved in outer membrane biogenesis
MLRRLIRWAVYLIILLIVVAVAAILSLDRIVKEVMESRLRHETGMETEIGQVEVGLLSPMITIKNLRLYNTPEFGGSIFVDMPELHLEYDPFAFRSNELHFKLVRLNLEEVSIIQDKKGRMNFQEMAKRAAEASARRKHSHQHIHFTGIDTLNLTLGRLRIANLATGREEDPPLGVRNEIIRNVKSEADLAGLTFLMAARGGAFSSPTNSGIDLTGLMKSLTH